MGHLMSLWLAVLPDCDQVLPYHLFLKITAGWPKLWSGASVRKDFAVGAIFRSYMHSLLQTDMQGCRSFSPWRLYLHRRHWPAVCLSPLSHNCSSSSNDGDQNSSDLNL